MPKTMPSAMMPDEAMPDEITTSEITTSEVMTSEITANEATAKERVRLVIWDLDETFWKGTLTEGGVTRNDRAAETVVSLARRGIVSSICSKNDSNRCSGCWASGASGSISSSRA